MWACSNTNLGMVGTEARDTYIGCRMLVCVGLNGWSRLGKGQTQGPRNSDRSVVRAYSGQSTGISTTSAPLRVLTVQTFSTSRSTTTRSFRPSSSF